MPKATRICKVCGEEYEYCHTLRRVDDVFRYQDVACCPEHGSIYFKKIAESREPKKIVKAKEKKKKNESSEAPILENNSKENSAKDTVNTIY